MVSRQGVQEALVRAFLRAPLLLLFREKPFVEARLTTPPPGRPANCFSSERSNSLRLRPTSEPHTGERGYCWLFTIEGVGPG